MAVITIARQFGAGGRTVGQMVARQLDYLFLDDAIIQEISKKARVTEASVRGMEKMVGGLISRIITSAISRGYMERLMKDSTGYMDENIYVETLVSVMTQFAERDNVILLGRGGQYILKDLSNAFHFLLVAEKEDRINFMKQHYKLSESAAAKAVADGSRRRANLYSKFGKTNYNDPSLYHLILNMSKMSVEQAVSQICSLVTSYSS